jgi:hypothetical protein
MGTELLVRQAYYLNRKTFFQIQYRREDKIRNITAADARDFATQPVVRENITLQAEHAISPSVTARFRFQSVSFRDNIYIQHGYFMCTDLMAKAGGLRLALRYGLFNADGADTKIYAAERDVWSVFAYTSLSGVGVRACAVAEYAFTSRIDGWVRLALTRYDDRESTGYGTERSEGPLRTELKVQLRYAW